MAKDAIALRFKDVSFTHESGKKTLEEANFALRQGSKLALMGQNGAGKTTLFNLINGTLKPTSGAVNRDDGLVIATQKQVVPRDEITLTVRDFFGKYFGGEDYELDRKIKDVLTIVNLDVPTDKKVDAFSGGQQARLLLAQALIQDPDVLLLDEPTNNLDAEGVGYLMTFLMMYEGTAIVISHDADFLNTFTDGVLYLDVWTQQIDQYVGDYYTVCEEIAAQVEKEKMKNAQFEKKIKENKEKINYFANKGGKMRLLAKKLKDEVAEMEASKVVVKQEDKAIRSFEIPTQTGDEMNTDIITINSLSVMQDGVVVDKPVETVLRKNQHLRITGPNGIGKTTLLERLATKEANGAVIADEIRVGYYRQDFSTLDFNATVFDALMEVMRVKEEEKLRSVAAGFLISREVMESKIGLLSEGQKGLVAFAQLVLMEPGLLILDEPTNHINFRHIPLIAEALSEYKGAMIVVSHVEEFVEQIRIDETLDLAK